MAVTTQVKLDERVAAQWELDEQSGAEVWREAAVPASKLGDKMPAVAAAARCGTRVRVTRPHVARRGDEAMSSRQPVASLRIYAAPRRNAKRRSPSRYSTVAGQGMGGSPRLPRGSTCQAD